MYDSCIEALLPHPIMMTGWQKKLQKLLFRACPVHQCTLYLPFQLYSEIPQKKISKGAEEGVLEQSIVLRRAATICTL